MTDKAPDMLYVRQETPPASGECKCAIASPHPEVIPPACPVHGVPCETCGQVEGCLPECEVAAEVESALARAGETAGVPRQQGGYRVTARTGAVFVTWLIAGRGERVQAREALARWAVILREAGWAVTERSDPARHLRVAVPDIREAQG